MYFYTKGGEIMGGYDYSNMSPEYRHLAAQYDQSQWSNTNVKSLKTDDEKLAQLQKSIDKLKELQDLIVNYKDNIKTLKDKVDRVIVSTNACYAKQWKGQHRDDFDDFLKSHEAAYAKYISDLESYENSVRNCINKYGLRMDDIQYPEIAKEKKQRAEWE